MIENNTPVDVICLIDKTGKITPLKIRMENDEGQNIISKITEVVYSKENNYAGFTTFDYGCKVAFDEIPQLIELRYYVSERIWKIHKVVWG